MSAIDWTPGPLLRGMMDRGADVVMRRIRDGVYELTVPQGEHRASRIRETAQAAADAMEDMLRVRGMGGRMNQEEAIEAAKALPWARWVAQDADGSWWAHATKPEFRMGEWDTGGLVAKLRPRDLKPGPCIEIQR